MFPRSLPVAMAASLSLFSAIGNAQILPLNQFFNLTTFPNEQRANVTRYLNEAAILGTDGSIHQYFQDQCIVQHLYPPLFAFPPGYIKPFAAFDNFYFVGHSGVSAWAYNTGDGIVLIDALDNQAEIEAILLPGLKTFGFQGSDIKHVIITHEHLDHYGGAKYLQEQFGSAVYASAPAWDGMIALGPTANPPVPAKDKTLVEGQVLTVGKVPFEIVMTPGHTPGTLSLIFPVREKNKTHMAGLSGGTGTPTDRLGREGKIVSNNRFAAISKSRRVDVLISNHQIADHSLFHADLLDHRPQGAPNPFVIGVDNFDKYMRIQALCSRVRAAREGMDLQV